MTTALCLPCVVVAGGFLERTDVEKALTDTTLTLAFLARFLFLIFLGPAHEVAIYACVLHNPALTTLVASGFKYTAMGAYHALVLRKLPGEAKQDEWDYLGTFVTALASAVYTVEWFKAATKASAGPSMSVGLHAPPPTSPNEKGKPRRVASSDQLESPWWARTSSVELVDRGRFGSVVRL